MPWNGGIDPSITYLISVDQKKQQFVFWSTLHHVMLTKTLNIPISETDGPISKLFFLNFSNE